MIKLGIRHPRKKEASNIRQARQWWSHHDLILLAFITWNNSSEPLIEGLLAQIHIDLSWRGFGRNRTGDLWITLLLWVMVTDASPKILQDPSCIVYALNNWRQTHTGKSRVRLGIFSNYSATFATWTSVHMPVHNITYARVHVANSMFWPVVDATTLHPDFSGVKKSKQVSVKGDAKQILRMGVKAHIVNTPWLWSSHTMDGTVRTCSSMP